MLQKQDCLHQSIITSFCHALVYLRQPGMQSLGKSAMCLSRQQVLNWLFLPSATQQGTAVPFVLSNVYA